ARRLAGDNRYPGRAQIEFGSATGERRYKQPAGDRTRRRRLSGLRAVVRVASELSDRANRYHMLGTGGEQHRSSGIAGRGDNGDTLLFRRDNALLDYGRAPVAAEPKAGNVDPSLHAIVERRDEIAATRSQRKPATM